MEFLILFSTIALFICAFLPTDNSDEHVLKFTIFAITLGFFAAGVYSLSYNKGIKDGAYNQLRGKYEVTYVIDKDSCVVDTIININ